MHARDNAGRVATVTMDVGGGTAPTRCAELRGVSGMTGIVHA